MKIKDFIDVVFEKISTLVSSKFTGAMSISINFNTGGLTKVKITIEEDVTKVDKN